MSDIKGKPFLGVGLGWPVGATAKGGLQRAEYEESVRQSIWLILSTARGERVMRPDFGCGLHEFVFSMNTASTAGRVAAEVRDALLRFETRIDVRNVEVKPSGEGEVLLISIDYEVRATNTAFNLVYPFYLQGGS